MPKIEPLTLENYAGRVHAFKPHWPSWLNPATRSDWARAEYDALLSFALGGADLELKTWRRYLPLPIDWSK